MGAPTIIPPGGGNVGVPFRDRFERHVGECREHRHEEKTGEREAQSAHRRQHIGARRGRRTPAELDVGIQGLAHLSQ